MEREPTQAVLKRIGTRVRLLRKGLGLSLKSLADKAQMSARFLSDVEAGRGNIAIGRLANLAGALETPLVSLVQPKHAAGPRDAIETLLDDCTQAEMQRLLSLVETALGKRPPRIVALVGIRGSGKTTVGSALAKTLDWPFVELARRIESRAGMSLGDLFGVYGEAHVRQVEHRCLVSLLAADMPSVVALPGGIVTRPDTLRLIRESCYSVWLKARVEDYWSRVFEQGDTRPMAGRSDALTDLRALLLERTPLYSQADDVLSTTGLSVSQVVDALRKLVERRRLHG